jgi:hypothetical protein
MAPSHLHYFQAADPSGAILYLEGTCEALLEDIPSLDSNLRLLDTGQLKDASRLHLNLEICENTIRSCGGASVEWRKDS